MSFSTGPLRGAETPFLVYALDTPTYPNLNAEYGQSKAMEQDGSLVIISGGYFEPNISNSNTDGIYMYGCIDMGGRIGNRFAEQVTSALIEPDARVTMLIYVSRVQSQEWLPSLRQVGFEVIETNDVVPGYDSKLAVCVGNGAVLAKCDWLREVYGYDIFYLLASKGLEGQLVKDIVSAARTNYNVDEVIAKSIDAIDRQPDIIKKVFGEQYLFAQFTDPDQRSMQIMRNDPDVSMIRPLFSRVAKELDIALYDAGNLRVQDENHHYFTDFADWDKWYSLPASWIRVA